MENTAKKMVYALLAGSTLLGGCSSTIHKTAYLDGISTLSVDAKQRFLVVNENGGPKQNRRVACAEPSPDAIVASAASLAGNANIPNSAAAAFAASTAESAGSIGLRTQTIQVLRDGYFRLCEAHMNGVIDRDDYRRVITNVDGVIAVVMALDALGGSQRAPGVVISPGTVNANADGTKASSGTTPAVSIGVLEQDSQSEEFSEAQAEAIQKVLMEYLAHKRIILEKYGADRNAGGFSYDK